ncbi:TPM domain-containing protein [Bacteroidia bacterium]|nr:TPM domain-containing protein [Bacteroidia bacterium]MDC1431035.1 TPM domain-containing protein [Bacteroidia bacterium]
MVRTGSLLILIFIAFLATAKKVPPAPTEYRWVQDYGNVLDADQELFLMNKLKKYFDSTSTEIVIVTENSLEGDDVFDYSYRLAQEWGVGQKDKDNGVLIYAAIRDRKMFIQVGKGAEGAFPDIYAKRVVENQLKPNFRKGKYGKGFDEATTVIIQHLSGEFVNGAPAGESEGIPIWVIILVVVLLVLMFTSGGNNGQTYTRGESSVRRRPHLPPFWIGGGGGGGFSGGGFGGGLGGGSFGGGGAGGSW